MESEFYRSGKSNGEMAPQKINKTESNNGEKMKLQQIKYNKFSIVLMMAIAFIALPVVTSAQALFREALAGEGKKVTIHFCKTDATILNQVDVSRISLLNGAFDGRVGVVDSFDQDAASKIKMLFDVRRNLGLTNDIVIEIPESNTSEWFEVMNYLRRAQASGTRIPVIELFVADSRNPQGYKVIMEDIMVTGYQTGGAESASTDSLALNYTHISFKYTSWDDK